MAKIKATCGACFSAVALNADGRIARHGWREVGGRKAGQHGHAWHVGNCFGSGRLPYETTAQTTVDYLDHVVLPASASARREVDRLSARPTLYVEAHMNLWYGRNDPKAIATLVIAPGSEPRRYVRELVCGEVEGLPTWKADFPAYDSLLQSRVRDANGRLSTITEAVAFCAEKIAAWTSAKAA